MAGWQPLDMWEVLNLPSVIGLGWYWTMRLGKMMDRFRVTGILNACLDTACSFDQRRQELSINQPQSRMDKDKRGQMERQ